MTDHLSLEVVDRDGAIREAAEDIGIDRSTFLRRGATVGAGFVAGGVLFGGLVSPADAAISTRRKSLANDIKIGNYALTLEYLEAEFYAQAVRNGVANTPALALFARVTGEHEAAHVAALKRILGRRAVKKPTFDFGDTVTDVAKFQQTAQVLEDTGVAAYAGQGPNIATRSIVQAALAIHSVEARHAAWIRFINTGDGVGEANELPAPRGFDRALSERAVLSAVGETGFIKS